MRARVIGTDLPTRMSHCRVMTGRRLRGSANVGHLFEGDRLDQPATVRSSYGTESGRRSVVVLRRKHSSSHRSYSLRRCRLCAEVYIGRGQLCEEDGDKKAEDSGRTGGLYRLIESMSLWTRFVHTDVSPASKRCHRLSTTVRALQLSRNDGSLSVGRTFSEGQKTDS